MASVKCFMHCISLAIRSHMSQIPSTAVGTNLSLSVDVPLSICSTINRLHCTGHIVSLCTVDIEMTFNERIKVRINSTTLFDPASCLFCLDLG